MPTPPLSIAICGTAAQAATLLLRDHGHAINIFERSGVLAPVGAGFLLQSAQLARSRLPIARTSMLQTLSGLQQGYFGVYDGIDVGKST